MSTRRRVALWGGFLAAAVGLALAVQPSLLAESDPGQWTVYLLGAIAMLYAGVPVYRRRKREHRVVAGPDPEAPAVPPPPGDEVDDMLAVAGSIDPRTADDRRRLRRRLRDAALASIRRREGCDADAAREMVEAGTWTDDPIAASYLSSGPVTISGAGLGLPERLRLRLSGPARRAYAAHRVADEVAALTDPGDR